MIATKNGGLVVYHGLNRVQKRCPTSIICKHILKSGDPGPVSLSRFDTFRSFLFTSKTKSVPSCHDESTTSPRPFRRMNGWNRNLQITHENIERKMIFSPSTSMIMYQNVKSFRGFLDAPKKISKRLSDGTDGTHWKIFKNRLEPTTTPGGSIP